MSLTITIPGAVNVTTGAMAPAVLTVGVGVPGAAGPQGPAGPGVPVGGTAGQYLQKIDGTNYNTDWVTVNLGAYAVKANNLSDLTNFGTARTNLGLGTMAVATAADYSTTTVANGLYYPLSGNPSSFLTAAALSPYLTTATAASTYAVIAAGQPTAGTTGQVLTKNSGTNYDSSWATLIPGDRYLTTSTTSNTVSNGNKTFTIGTGLSYTPTQNITISYDASNHMHGEVLTYNSGTGVLTVDVNHHTGSGTYTAWVVNVGGVTPATSVAWGAITGTLSSQTDLQSALDLKLAATTAATTYYPLVGNPSAFLVAADINGKANLASPDFTGNVTINSSTGAALFITQTGTGNILTLYDQALDTTFVAIDANGKVNTIASETTNGAGFNIAHGAAPTTPVNGDIWTTTSGVFARINAGTQQLMSLGNTQTVSGSITFSNANQTLGNSTAASTINIGTGATLTATTKAVNIGTNGVSGSTTNITVGPVLGASTTSIGNTTAASTLNLATGATLTATTKAVNIGTSGVAGSTTNITIGSTTGTSTTTLQGITNGITEAVDTNNTELATTAFVVGQAGSATPLVNGTAAVGTSLRYARQDHVHGTDTTRAPLASPTFTGTPTLPTGTIATTQSPGNNTTAVATTAFVQAALPALATLTDSRQLTNDTKAMSPNDVLWSVMTQDYIDLDRINFTYTTTGTPQWNHVGSITTNSRLNATVASSVIGRPFGTSQVDQVSPFLFRNNWGSNINFNLKTYLSGRAGSFALLTDAAFNQAFYFGKVEGDAIGDLTRRGFGWRWTGGAGSRFVNLVVHNGTTLTVVASSFAVTSEVAFDWDLYSDGTGNVTLYINGSQVATSNAGPTSYQSAGTYAWWREEAWTTAAPSFGNHTSFFRGGRAAILNY